MIIDLRANQESPKPERKGRAKAKKIDYTGVVVSPQENPRASFIIVGDAPEEEDAITGRLFSGNSGRLLNEVLSWCGIPAASCYFTNVINTYSSSVNYYWDQSFNLKQSIIAEIQAQEATVIIALGAIALDALIGKRGILEHRGTIFESPLFPGKQIVATTHPSFVMAGNEVYKYIMKNDLEKASKTQENPTWWKVNRNLIIDPSPALAFKWLDDFSSFAASEIDQGRVPELCVDIEINGARELSCIGFSYDPLEALCVPVLQWDQVSECKLWRIVADIFGNEKIATVGQNVAFDLFFLLWKHRIITKGPIHDTMIAHNVMFPDMRKSLGFLCSFYLTEPYYKDEGKAWKNVQDWPMFWRYNAKDAACTLDVWQKQSPMLEANGYQITYERTVRLHEPLFYMMHRGIATNPGAIKSTGIAIQKNINRLCAELDAQVAQVYDDWYEGQYKKVVVDKETKLLGYLNVNSPKQMKTYFYQMLNIPPYRNNGKETCDDTALQRLAKGTASRAGRPEARTVQELVGLKKFRGTYLNMRLDDDSRFRCTLNPRGTYTGRLSSDKTLWETGTNQQNLPPQFKTFLLADPGYVMIEIDKEQAEWVATANISGDVNMLKVLSDGLDPHLFTAEFITGLPQKIINEENDILNHMSDVFQIEKAREEFIAEGGYREAYNNATFIPRTMSCRQAGKKSNHGFNYGLGPGTFAVKNEIPDVDAKACHAGYHGLYPGLGHWYQEIRDEIDHDRTLTNCYGRKIQFLGKISTSLHMEAFAFKPQSTVVDGVNDALVKAYYSPHPAAKYAEFLAHGHDSLIFQFPMDRPVQLAAFLLCMKHWMEPTLNYDGREFIIGTDMKMGLSWGAMNKCKFYDNIDSQSREVSRVIKELTNG